MVIASEAIRPRIMRGVRISPFGLSASSGGQASHRIIIIFCNDGAEDGMGGKLQTADMGHDDDEVARKKDNHRAARPPPSLH